MVNALWCHAQLANCDGVCVHGEKAARLYKPAHFTAWLYLHQVSNGALDANPWPGASFITNANEIWDIFGFTNGATGVQEVINSAFWRMVLLHLQRKRSWKNGHSFQTCLLKTWKHSKLPTHVRSRQFFSLIINPLFPKVRFNLEWNVESKKKKRYIQINHLLFRLLSKEKVKKRLLAPVN